MWVVATYISDYTTVLMDDDVLLVPPSDILDNLCDPNVANELPSIKLILPLTLRFIIPYFRTVYTIFPITSICFHDSATQTFIAVIYYRRLTRGYGTLRSRKMHNISVKFLRRIKRLDDATGLAHPYLYAVLD